MKLRRLPAIASSLCAVAVALGAYASHVASIADQRRLALAALFAFAHGLALILITSRTSMLATIGKLLLVSGVILFSGSLAAAGLFSTSTVAAPLGGSCLILGWLLIAVDFWQQP